MTIDTRPLIYGEEVASTYSSIESNVQSGYGQQSTETHDDDVEEVPLSQIPNLFLIQLSLFSNVFLAGFDGTITASTYQLIGNEFNHVSVASWITTAYLVTDSCPK